MWRPLTIRRLPSARFVARWQICGNRECRWLCGCVGCDNRRAYGQTKTIPGTGNVKDIVFSPDSKSVLLARSGGFDGSRADDVAIYRLVLSDDVEKLFR